MFGAVLFVALVSWLRYIAWLGGSSPGASDYLLLNAAAVGAAGNAVSGALYLRFLLEHERLGETTAALRGRNDRLDRFASMMSHDLRNPLAIARGRVELAYEEPESARHHLEPALDALARINDRVDDLLALARDGEVNGTATVSLRDVAETAWAGVDTHGATLDIQDARTPANTVRDSPSSATSPRPTAGNSASARARPGVPPSGSDPSGPTPSPNRWPSPVDPDAQSPVSARLTSSA